MTIYAQQSWLPRGMFVTQARSSKTIIITGGTDGIGRALADRYLALGDTVVVIGRSAAKGRNILDMAEPLPGTAHFIQADLASTTESERVAEQILARFPVVDALVFCARYYRSVRATSPEGLEENFSLFYLSRYILGYRLVPALKRSRDPIVINVAGPGAPLDLIQWDNLQLTEKYNGNTALGQGGKLNDLLAVSFVADPATAGIRYLLVHPGVTATSFSGDYAPSIVPHIEAMKQGGKSITESAAPIITNIDDALFTGLRALVEGQDIDVSGRNFDGDAAARLHAVTNEFLNYHTR